jgi:hypothetical protein
MYSDIIYDIDGKDFKSLTRENLMNPEIGYDLMELYMLADYLTVTDLTDMLLHSFISPASLFSPFSGDAHTIEAMLSSMIAKCSGMYQDRMIGALAGTYVRATGGLSCLCQSPTTYPRCICCTCHLSMDALHMHEKPMLACVHARELKMSMCAPYA